MNEGTVRHELGVTLATTVYEGPGSSLAEGVERIEEVIAGGGTDAVGSWEMSLILREGGWFVEVECLYGKAEVIALGGELDGVSFPGPIDFDAVSEPPGPFASREDALRAVADRLLAQVALLSGNWEPSLAPLESGPA
jgi:hypothetical protein